MPSRKGSDRAAPSRDAEPDGPKDGKIVCGLLLDDGATCPARYMPLRGIALHSSRKHPNWYFSADREAREEEAAASETLSEAGDSWSLGEIERLAREEANFRGYVRN